MISQREYLNRGKNKLLKNKCQLSIGNRFIFQGDYCTVTAMFPSYFKFHNQRNDRIYGMTYGRYLETPSAAGRKLNHHKFSVYN